ncbi:MAG: DNA mismatch repair endonuclease MutL [Oscillospiraceae bacterium]|jgi:DNA mismatch repair protein MutL|nr:DNA mismatch repair endonuclease MutL [Oscillospiraceae bacterium]
MSKIHTLAPHVADLIAAGEVVERPAAAVKELIENAIDAGATAVTVESAGGGVRLLRVTDNGEGMAPEDAQAAFLRHATSKIRSAEDLTAVRTLGFRGEALAAIAAVSRVQLITRVRGGVMGTALMLEAGAVTESRETGCPEGTTLVVRDLFYNTPARQKFLKKDTTESAHVQAVVQRAALSHPEISFQYVRDGRPTLHTPGDGNLRSCLYSVFGRAFAEGLCEVPPSEQGGVRVWGFVSRPEKAQGSRQAQHVLVSGRPVHARTVTAALEEAGRHAVMAGRYPACVLHLDLPPSAYDVNVHPAKSEIKFSSEREIFDAVFYAVRGALSVLGRPEWEAARPSAPQVPRAAFHASARPRPDAWRTMTAEQYRAQADTPAAAPPVPVADAGRPAPVSYASPAAELPGASALPLSRPGVGGYGSAVRSAQPAESSGRPGRPESAETRADPEPPPPWRFVGEVMDGVLIVEETDGILLIDKHAAHERIVFNRLKERRTAQMAQVLLTPLVLTPPPAAAAVLLEHAEMLSEMGFLLEDFGDGALLVREAPADVDAAALPALLDEVSERLREGRRDSAPRLFDDILHMVACRSAVKLGRRSHPGEAEALAAQVAEDPALRHCPHGRPVAVSISRADMMRQFKRQ